MKYDLIDDSKIKRMLKYLSMFLIALLLTYYVPKNPLDLEQIIIISLGITSFYAFLEIYFPSIYINKFVI
jgi:hypothetical protein